MLISTKGRYALRVLIDLAEHRTGGYLPMKEIADRQEISPKYLERIMLQMSKAGLVDGAHGKGGGYRLTKEPADYSVLEILRSAEDTLAPVACLQGNMAGCEKAPRCRTLPVWQKLDALITGYLGSVTLADLLQVDAADEYVI